VQIIQHQLDKLSALCTFCTRAYRDIFPRPELFSKLLHAALKHLANDPTKKKKTSVQLCASSNSCQPHSGSVPISSCIDRNDETTCSTSLPSAASTVDAVDLSCFAQRTCPSSATATADCSRPSLQLFRQTRTSSLQCQIYSNCSRSSLQLPGNAKSPCKPHPLWTAHRFHYFALQSEPTTASQFLHLASNSNTLHNLWHLCPYSHTSRLSFNTT